MPTDINESSELLYSTEEILDAINNMAMQIDQKLSGKKIVSVCVMNGAMIFFSQLVSKMKSVMTFDYIHATRYQNEIRGADIAWKKSPDPVPDDHVVLVIDDILDEGFTLEEIVRKYRDMGVKNIYTAVLVIKEGTQKVDLNPDFTGLTVPDRYVYGFGMDYKGYFRNIPAIYAIGKD